MKSAVNERAVRVKYPRLATLVVLITFSFGICSCAPTSENPRPNSLIHGVWGLPNEPRVKEPSQTNKNTLPEKNVNHKPVSSFKPFNPQASRAFMTNWQSSTFTEEQTVDGGSLLNFQNAPLDKVIQVFAKLLDLNVALDPKVKGKVTLHSGGRVPKSELFATLETILEINGAALVGQGSLYRVVPLKEAKKAPLSPRIHLNTGASEGFGIEVFIPQYISAAEAAKILKPFVTGNGEATAMMPANILVVAESGLKLRRLRSLIKLLDQPISNRVHINLYPVRRVDIQGLTDDLRKIFQAMGIPHQPTSGVWAELVPLPHLGSLAVISTFPETFRTVERWLVDLDRQISENEETVFVYYCQNGNARNIAGVLASLYGSRKRGSGGSSEDSGWPTITPVNSISTSTMSGSSLASSTSKSAGRSNSIRTENQKTVTKQRDDQSYQQQELENGIRFVVDHENNAIVIKSLRKHLYSFLETIRKLDSFPKQVLIEVIIAEIQLSDLFSLGLEWATMQGENSDPSTDFFITPPANLTPSSGLKYAILRTGQIVATLRALAQEGKVNVISSPILLASENTESRINVGEEVPIITDLTTSTNYESDDGRKVVDRSIQYRDTGIIMAVVPRINDSGLVRMTIHQELTDVSATAFGDTESPSFFKRTAVTSVATVDGQTVVIGGLIKERNSIKESGVPFFKDIPLLGYAFKTEKKTTDRTELIITLTPHVIHDLNDARTIFNAMGQHLSQYQGLPSGGQKIKSLNKHPAPPQQQMPSMGAPLP